MKTGKINLDIGPSQGVIPGRTGRTGRSDIPSWKIIIIDDEPDVHQVTRMILKTFSFDGQRLELISGYSGAEAMELLRRHPDAAVVLLDVVMEEEDSGLKVVRWIRDVAQNRFVRIILRTGQPGQAPEDQVTTEYDINDYREKAGLTDTSLATSLISALRSYRDIRALDRTRNGLEKIIKATGNLFDVQSLDELAAGILTQLTAFFNPEGSSHASGPVECFVAAQEDGVSCIHAALGTHALFIGKPVEDVVTPSVLELIEEGRKSRGNQYRDRAYLGYFLSRKEKEHLIYLQLEQPLSKADHDLLNIFSLNIAAAFENLALNKEIINTQKDVIFVLGEVIEARSGETGHHVRRVAECSRLMARLLGLAPQEIELLWLASPMHDLGKIGISDTILNKPGPLTDEEWHIVRQHPEIGSTVLQGQKREVFQSGAIICSQHHEKWDGSGYPRGLKGDDIHIFARITALIDVFDALYHARAYKPAWSLDRILQLLAEEKGRHFEPRLVDLFMDHLDAFITIQAKYSG
ncbi:MAG: DUF3369 domain-containing protein [Magnetococcales bacterium]|nr:DUF3369 domain-containing protein [Magnetococcales bacterium]